MNQIPNGFDFAQLLDPHVPPTVRVPLSVTAGVSPSRLLLAAEPGMVCLLEEKSWIYGSWGCGKKNLHRDNIWVFVGGLGNSNPPIKSALNVKVASVSLFTKISWFGGFGFQRLFLLLGYGSKYSPPNGWMIGKHDP